MFISVASAGTQPGEPLDSIGLFVLRPQDGEVTVGEYMMSDSSEVTEKLNTIHNLILTYFPYKVETLCSLPKWQVRAC